MPSIVRDLGSPELWELSLERSLRRRELAASARREQAKRRRASIAATAAVAVAPVATSVASARSAASGDNAATAAQPDGARDANPVLLELGSTGPSVRQVQISLDLVVDGIYGPRTERAVFHFQRVEGLPATGKVDRRTWITLLRNRPTAQATVSSVRPVAIEQPSPRAAAPDLQPARAPAPAAAEPGPKAEPSHVRQVAKLKVPVAPRRPAVPHRARPAAASAPASSAPAASGSTGRILAAIASCESGGNPTAVGGGGTYRGMYQFDQQTWESVGGTGDPAAASPADQTKRAAILYGQRGASAWPTCGRAAAQAASTAHMTVVSARSQQQPQPQQPQQPQPTVSAAGSPEPSATATAARPTTVASAAPKSAQEKVTAASAPSDQSARSDSSAGGDPAQSKSASQSKTGATSVQGDSSTQSPPSTAARLSQLNQSAPTSAVTQSAPVPASPVAGGSPQGAASGPADMASGTADPASSVQGIATPPASQAQVPDPGASQQPDVAGSAGLAASVDAHPGGAAGPSDSAAKEH